MKRFLLLLMLAFMLVSCDNNAIQLKDLHDNEIDYRGEPITLRVWVFEHAYDLQRALDKIDGSKDWQRVHGSTIWTFDKETKRVLTCDILVIRSDYQNDPDLYIWGHELKHCIKGDFHTPTE